MGCAHGRLQNRFTFTMVKFCHPVSMPWIANGETTLCNFYQKGRQDQAKTKPRTQGPMKFSDAESTNCIKAAYSSQKIRHFYVCVGEFSGYTCSIIVLPIFMDVILRKYTPQNITSPHSLEAPLHW